MQWQTQGIDNMLDFDILEEIYDDLEVYKNESPAPYTYSSGIFSEDGEEFYYDRHGNLWL